MIKAVYVDHRPVEEPLFPALSFSIALKRDKPGIVGAWIIEARLTAKLSKSIMIARSHSPQYCVFSKDEKEGVEVLFEIDPWRLEKMKELREGKDVWLRIDLRMCEVDRNSLVKHPERVTVCGSRTGGNTIKIAKSEWMEQIHFSGNGRDS